MTLVGCILISLAAVSSSASPPLEILLRTHQFDPLITEPQIELPLRGDEPAPGGLGYYLVQLDGPVADDHKATLTARGIEILHYVPDYAFLVRMTPEAASAARALRTVRWVGLYHPAYKLDPAIGAHEFNHPDRIADPWLWLIVRVYDHVDADAAAAALQALGGEIQDVVRWVNKRVLLRMPPEKLPDIARIPEVLFVMEQGEYFLHNNTTRWVVQSNQSGTTSVWSHGLHGENQLIAEMDSGVDYQSCFFRDPDGNPIGASHRKIQSYTAYGGGVAYDGCDNGHGSHVAGTLLGNDITGGNSAYNGIAYNSRLVFQDVGADDSWACTTGSIAVPSELTTAYTDAYATGARIHTNSWGGQDNQYIDFCEDIDSFMWSNPDFLILFAMGNAGPDAGSIGYPATAKNCASVGGTQQAATQDNMYSSSSRGPCYDDRRKPDVCAPACGVNGSSPHIWSCDNSPSSSQTCAIVGDIWQGTSMATPAVAGCAALIRQYFMEGFYPGGSPSPGSAFTPSAALIKATLVASGQRMTQSGLSYPDNNQGWGRVLLENALFFSGDDIGLDVVDNTAGLSTGSTYTRQVPIGAGQPVRFALVWTDPAGAPPANPALVNNLNLTVTDPVGSVYLGNVFSGNQSTTGGSADALNNVEVVHRDSPSAGQWTIQVTGANVPTGPQPFALVITGDLETTPPDTEPPGCVGDLSAEPGVTGGIWLTWSNPGDNVGVTKYDIYRSLVAQFLPVLGGELHSLMGNPPASEWTDPDAGATPGEQYFYRIIAADEAGNRSEPSNTAGDSVYELP